jgi:TatD DNase family protein
MARAWEAGITRILVPGIDLESSRHAVQLADTHEAIFAAVGVHPSDANTWTPETLAGLRELAQHPKVVAVGEIGLDYFRDRAPRPLQRSIFQAQLELAASLGLPVVVHNRDSFSDLWPMLSAWADELSRTASPLSARPGVLHSFTGNLEEGLAAAKKCFFLGISGPVTFTNAPERQRITAGLPTKALLLETDAPYLTPHPYRGKRNEPAYTALIAKKMGELFRLDESEIENLTADNAARLFVWEP